MITRGSESLRKYLEVLGSGTSNVSSMNDTEEVVSDCIEEVLTKSDAVECATQQQRNALTAKEDELTESHSNIAVNKASEAEGTNADESVQAKSTSYDTSLSNEGGIVDASMSSSPRIELSDTNGNSLYESADVEQISKSADDASLRPPTSSQAHQSTKTTGWIFQGEHNGYVYYTNNAGQVYSVDRNGYWYIQQESGDFIPYDSSLHYVNVQLQMFPLNDDGRPTLPSNAQGEKVFPTDANHMPIFPLDPKTNLPTFPVDDLGQPVFPTGVNGRAIVPVDSNGAAIFPRGENGRFIFPSGANGNPVAPVNIYGVPVLPLDSNGKPVIPYDSNGGPLIHLANDGITPLTEEEYQYSLQWNDYYDKYNQYYHHQQASQQGSSSIIAATSAETFEQHEKNLKLLKKVRPEDIDLPPSEPPPATGPVPISMTPVSAVPQQEQPKDDEKAEAEMQLKAKTKRLLEMQLRFTRKAAFGGGRTNSSKVVKVNDSTSDAGDGSSERGAAALTKDDFGLQAVQLASTVGDTDAENELVESAETDAIADESVAQDSLLKSVSVQKLSDRTSFTETSSNQHKLGCDGEEDNPVLQSSNGKEVLDSSREESEDTQNMAGRSEQSATKSLEKDSADGAVKGSDPKEIRLSQDSSQETVRGASSETMKPPAAQTDSARSVNSSSSKLRSCKDGSNKENERRYSRSSSEERPRNLRRSSSRRRRSTSRNNRDSLDRERLYSERSYRSHRWRDSRSRSDSYSPRYRSRSPPRRRVSSFRRSRSSPRYSSRSPDRSRDRYSRRERSSSRTRRYIRERSTQRRGRSSSRERSPYRSRSSYRSHWERSSSRRRSRSLGYSSPRRGDDNDRSHSRHRWSRRRSRNRSLHRSSRSTNRSPERVDSRTSRTSCSPRSANDSAKRTAVRSTVSNESRSNDSANAATMRSLKSNGSRSVSPMPLPSDLTSVRSDVSSKLISSTKTITSHSEKSITERSESDEHMGKAKKSKEKKRKKKKRDRKRSSSRKSKEDSARVQDDEPATEATPTKESQSRVDNTEASEAEPVEIDSYGPLPPKMVPNDGESETNEISELTKGTKSKKDKGTKKKKKKKRKRKSKGSDSEHEEDMQESSHHAPEVDEAEADGIEPGEIREQDPSPKSYVEESDGLSVVFIGPKWEGNTKNNDTTKLSDDSVPNANDTAPKMFYTKFIRETISSPIVTFTSNPTMAESFVKLKREFDAADGPRRSVQASKHFQAAMEILNESTAEQRDATDEPSIATLASKHLAPKGAEPENNESKADSKWKSLEETTRERREKKKAKKEKKLKRALEKEEKIGTGDDVKTSLTEEKDAETTAQVEGSDVKAAHHEQINRALAGSADEVVTKESEVLTEKEVIRTPLSGSEVNSADKSETSAEKNREATEETAKVVSESLQPSVVHTESVAETDTTLSTGLGTCDTQPSVDACSINESLSAASLKTTVIPPQSDNQMEPCVTDVAVASTSGKGEKGTQADDETRRRKEIMKRKLEEEEEDELSRLRYEALRSKTRRLMNDLRMERRRLKRERLRATLAMRRARGYDDDISVDDLLMADSSETSDTDDSNASNRANRKTAKRKLIKRARTSGDGSWRYNRYKSLNIRDDEMLDLRMQTIDESMAATSTVTACKSPPIADCSSQNDLISELQNRIGGTNKGALQLLEQLRRSLATSRGANIHLNPDMIRNSP